MGLHVLPKIANAEVSKNGQTPLAIVDCVVLRIRPVAEIYQPVNFASTYSFKHRLQDSKMTNKKLVSHTRTVVRECCKGDDQSQWRRANFNPPPPLNPLTDHYQNLHR